MRRISLIALVAVTLSFASVANAGVIQREILSDPHSDVSLLFGMYSFDGTTFNMTGAASSLRRNGTNKEIKLGAYNGVPGLVFNRTSWSENTGRFSMGQFSITMNFDSSGNLDGTGELEIRGALQVSPTVSPNVSLLKATITDVDSSVFGTKGRLYIKASDLSGQFYDDGDFTSEVLIKVGGLAKGHDFTAAFLGTMATSDVGRPVPEPSSMAVWICGALSIGAIRRRRARCS